MTDNDVIKAFDACVNGFCLDEKCPVYKGGDCCSRTELEIAVLSLINRQIADIDALQSKCDSLRSAGGRGEET